MRAPAALFEEQGTWATGCCFCPSYSCTHALAQAYEERLQEQLRLQRDLNNLLQRKSSWSDADLQQL